MAQTQRSDRRPANAAIRITITSQLTLRVRDLDYLLTMFRAQMSLIRFDASVFPFPAKTMRFGLLCKLMFILYTEGVLNKDCVSYLSLIHISEPTRPY